MLGKRRAGQLWVKPGHDAESVVEINLAPTRASPATTARGPV